MGEAFTTVVSIINVLPSPNLDNKNPYQMLFNKPPNYNFYKTFGCTCYPMLQPYNNHKFNFRLSMCLFIGYISTHKRYVCLSSSSKTYITCHVV